MTTYHFKAMDTTVTYLGNSKKWVALLSIGGKQFYRSFAAKPDAEQCLQWLSCKRTAVKRKEICLEDVKSEFNGRWPSSRSAPNRKLPVKQEVNPWNNGAAQELAAKIECDQKARKRQRRQPQEPEEETGPHDPKTTVGNLFADINMPDAVRIRFVGQYGKLLATKANHVLPADIERMRRLRTLDHNVEFQPVWAGLVRLLEAR